MLADSIFKYSYFWRTGIDTSYELLLIPTFWKDEKKILFSGKIGEYLKYDIC